MIKNLQINNKWIDFQTEKKIYYPPLNVAILDMYLGVPNQGKKNIIDLLDMQILPIKYEIFDVRGANHIPSLDYDIYISTGGPGSPLDGDGIWDKNYFKLIDDIWNWNKNNEKKKYVLFICHSFQMICNHFKLGTLCKRRSTSFGIFPIYKTEEGINDPVMGHLPDPFFAADSRDWQIVQPNLEVFETFGAKILCLEKIRDHVNFERAIMAVRISDEFLGTQFHPEADTISMLEHYNVPENKQKAIAAYGEKKVNEIIELLHDPTKINLTNKIIIPQFLKHCVSNFINQNI